MLLIHEMRVLHNISGQFTDPCDSFLTASCGQAILLRALQNMFI